ncbi:MAG: TonB-dependent receptor plug domain-containing protein, partial [Gemmatimonadetes bacterium]|nr:TonB-dependent receptor plug domain-containing protein [Gemmatimonadota bacterium]
MSTRTIVGILATLALSAATDAWSQASGTVTGLVRDVGSLAPVSAAQVYIPQLGVGSLTQANGRYVLVNVPAGTHTIQAERIGYRTISQQITVVAGQSVEANFALAEDALALDEIVVTGTAGQARRREVGNQIVQVNLAEVAEPVRDVGTLLQGRVAGARIAMGGGSSGGGMDIRLRGNVSVAMSNQPLIYVDGVRMKSEPYPRLASDDYVSPLNDINPDDIDRIEIVKGPAATTLYGTEAAAGVIQIFTKRGGQGAPQWTAETQQGFAYMRPFATDEVPFYYIDPVMRKGHRQRYSLSVQGGAADRFSYFVSSGWEDNLGVVRNDYEKQL